MKCYVCVHCIWKGVTRFLEGVIVQLGHSWLSIISRNKEGFMEFQTDGQEKYPL